MRILIIDDDNDIARSLEKFLTIKGHSCKTLNRGSEGLQAIQADTFDVILLDLRMPEWNGFDILRMLAYGGVLHDKKVVVISALDRQGARADEGGRSGRHTEQALFADHA
ncbi:MAG: response regulator [Nitrososphaera sp.]|jgi:DNA-binding response OmpR family regulator